jgi:arylformamidase
METVFDLNGHRMVDLSKPLIPGAETRRLAVRRYLSGPMNDFHSEIDIMSHLGTHVESPYHSKDEWKDTLELPLTSFIGRAVVLDLKNIEPRAQITGADLDRANAAGIVREGDIILLNSPYFLEPFTADTNTEKDKRPFAGKSTAEWLAAKNVKAVGFNDTVSIESSVEDVTWFHHILLAKDIIFLEVLKNFDQLRSQVFLLMYFPLPIAGLDSCPVRCVALEGVPGFC